VLHRFYQSPTLSAKIQPLWACILAMARNHAPLLKFNKVCQMSDLILINLFQWLRVVLATAPPIITKKMMFCNK
jgi:hypothetical protein